MKRFLAALLAALTYLPLQAAEKQRIPLNR